MNLHKRITIGADDFALDAATSSAILDLAAERRISAVSCLTDAPLWKEMGKEMLPHRGNVLMGLHFNLTQPFSDARHTLRRTILAALLRRLDADRIAAELLRQIYQFASVVGHLPDFIDGHEHVHAFPVVATVVQRTAENLSPATPIPIRSVGNLYGPTDAPLKRAVIRNLAALGSRETAGLRQNSLNTGFAGDYSLHARADFAGLFQAWLELAPDRAFIMCHPRRDTASTRSAGGREFCFLGSPTLARLLDRHLIRFLRRDEIERRLPARSRAAIARRA
jgi:predicted glycoside hydrolase/deacetylase ChbG (UPF0249 family)